MMKLLAETDAHVPTPVVVLKAAPRSPQRNAFRDVWKPGRVRPFVLNVAQKSNSTGKEQNEGTLNPEDEALRLEACHLYLVGMD